MSADTWRGTAAGPSEPPEMKHSAVICILVFLLAVRPAFAACTSPAGAETQIIYNQDYHTFQFCNGTAWMSMSGGGPGTGPMSLISTQTASASASLQFTSLPTTYNTYLLNCNALLPATNAVHLQLQFGEGATPTWETASYRYTVGGATDGSSWGVTTSTSATMIQLDGGTATLTSTASWGGANFQVWISNVAGSTQDKIADWTGGFGGNTPNLAMTSGAGIYTGDTNAITAFRVQFSSGNITSGTCSLYGVN
jgi:hypothetical protein